MTYTPQPEYAFLFDRRTRPELHYVMYVPGLHDYQDEANPGKDWYLAKAHFKEWLKNLLRELGEPDRFQTLALILSKKRVGFQHEEEAGDGPFTVREYDLLVEKIDLASEKLEETELEEEQIEVIRLKFERMKKMGKSLDRSDWEDLFIGTMVTATIQEGLSDEESSSLWQILRKVFNNLLIE
jgi:hypothetical protein